MDFFVVAVLLAGRPVPCAMYSLQVQYYGCARLDITKYYILVTIIQLRAFFASASSARRFCEFLCNVMPCDCDRSFFCVSVCVLPLR